MTAPRQLPDLEWARRYLDRQDLTDTDVVALCRDLSTADWSRLKNAWRQRNHRKEGPFAMGLARSQHDQKRLGGLWLRLVRSGLLSHADAMALAEHGNGPFGAWGDPGCRAVVGHYLAAAAETCRNAGRDAERSVKRMDAALKLYADKEGITVEAARHKVLG
jgi:hypothetical protein